MDGFFDGMPDDYAFEFHCGAMVSGVVAQVNWLFDLILHGEDIARSAGVPWEIRERDMLLLLRDGLELAPAYLSATVSPTTDICVALLIPEAFENGILQPKAGLYRRRSCRLPKFGSSPAPLNCGDAACLTSCHRAFVSNSCHFSERPQIVHCHGI
jgi:hypothetical protein